MTSKLYNFCKGAIDYIMPFGSSDDEHSVRAGQTGATSGHLSNHPKVPKAATARVDDGRDADSSSSLTLTGKRGIEEGGRSSRPRSTRKVAEDKGTNRPSSAQSSPSYIRDHTKKRKTAVQESAKDLARDVEALREQLRTSQKDLLEANSKFTNAEKRIRTLEDENHTLADQYKVVQDTYAGQLKAAQGRLAELEARNRKQEGELRVVREKLNAAEEKNHNLGKLLEERTADFKGTQAFMTTADSYSGAEIMSMVESMNAEIFQIAAFTAELVETDTLGTTPEERMGNLERFRAHLVSAERRLGHDLSSHLSNKYVEVRADPLPLQLAIQALLSYECATEIRTFRYSHFGESLDQLYRKIKASEAPAVAGRWRAITNSKMRATRDYSRVDIVLNMIIGLLCACGLSISNIESNPQILTLQKMLYTLLEKLQIQLKTAVMEGITTADMEVFLVVPGSHLSASVEDIYAETQGRVPKQKTIATRVAEKRILCTVGLGLRKSATKILHNGELKDQIDILLKPKVVSSSVLHDVGAGADSPPQGQDGK